MGSDDGLRAWSLLGPEDVERMGGLPGPAIVGLVTPEGLAAGRFTPETFRPNPAFADLLHAVIARRGPELSGLQAEARRVGNGWVYVLDGRSADVAAGVPPEDIYGAFEARAGEVVPGSYLRGPRHQLVTARGLFRLPAELHQCLLEELRALPMVPPEPG